MTTQKAPPRPAPARMAAYKALNEVFFSSHYSTAALQRHTAALSPADASLASQIVYGTIKKQNKLNKIITSLSRSRTSEPDPQATLILSMSLYQMLYLEKVPEYAIVNDAVNMAKTYIGKGVANFINGVLRNAGRQKALLAAPEKAFAARMEYDYGISPTALKAYRSSLSDERIEACAQAFEKPPITFLRVNTLKTNTQQLLYELEQAGFAASEQYVPGSIALASSKGAFLTQMHKRGEFFAQDLSGQISAYALSPQKGDKLIDVCAAPGSKSFSAYLVSGGASITSCDINAKRLDTLYRGAKQLSIPLRTQRRDASSDCPESGAYDKAICDVPCSGLGVVGRKPEILLGFSTAKEASLAELQLEILQNAFGYLKAGGLLLYSTCTMARPENEGLIERFLAIQKNAKLHPISLPFALRSDHREAKDGLLALAPDADGCDGFFMALLQKEA